MRLFVLFFFFLMTALCGPVDAGGDDRLAKEIERVTGQGLVENTVYLLDENAFIESGRGAYEEGNLTLLDDVEILNVSNGVVMILPKGKGFDGSYPNLTPRPDEVDEMFTPRGTLSEATWYPLPMRDLQRHFSYACGFEFDEYWEGSTGLFIKGEGVEWERYCEAANYIVSLYRIKVGARNSTE